MRDYDYDDEEVREERKTSRIDNSDIISQLRRAGSGFDDLEDYLDEFEESDD